MSEALAQVFGRYEAQPTTVSGVFSGAYGADARWGALVERVRDLAAREGRRPRVLLAKLGQDGHDRGVKVVAAGLADAGFDVDLGPLFQTPAEAARQAVESDVHVVGVSTQAGGHRTLVPELLQELHRHAASDIRVVVGGIVPREDRALLSEAGVSGVFGPGTPVVAIAEQLLDLLTASGAPAAV